MDEKTKANSPGHAILRGILIGGSIGMIAGWFGYQPVKAFFMGMICGIFAAATKIFADRLRDKEPPQ
jgi:hypothetical protein